MWLLIKSNTWLKPSSLLSGLCLVEGASLWASTRVRSCCWFWSDISDDCRDGTTWLSWRPDRSVYPQTANTVWFWPDSVSTCARPLWFWLVLIGSDWFPLQADLEARSLRVLVVSFGVSEGARLWLQQTGCNFDMMLDPERKVSWVSSSWSTLWNMSF